MKNHFQNKEYETSEKMIMVKYYYIIKKPRIKRPMSRRIKYEIEPIKWIEVTGDWENF
jgi:hypothetical protein